MLERKSALADGAEFRAAQVTMREMRDFELTQVAGSEAAMKIALGTVPGGVGAALDVNGRRYLRIGPKQLWILGKAPAEAKDFHVTPLSSSRSCIVIEGEGARDLLLKCAPIDFHHGVFKPGQFVMTGIHHMPVLIHCVGPNVFHLYALRTFARTLWEMLVDAAG
jgi:methylglutamate dehydrogenase subunit D